MVDVFEVKGRTVEPIQVGDQYIGVLEVDGVRAVVRLNDKGDGFPSGSDVGCTLCRISNNRKCQDEIPSWTPPELARTMLDACIASKCKGECTGGDSLVGGGFLVLR